MSETDKPNQTPPDTHKESTDDSPVKPATVGGAPPEGTSFTPREIILVFVGVGLGVLLGALDQTIVGVALPKIVQDLGNENLLSWVVSAYLLTSSAVFPILGRVSDIFGRNLVFQVSIWVFLVGSLVSAVSVSMTMLIIARAVQGLGAGGIFSLTFIIVGDVVAPRERGKYQAIISGVWAIASVAGPLVGGGLTDGASWRWVFYINLPLGAIASGMSYRILSRIVLKQTQQANTRLDYLGCVLVAGSTVILMLAITWGGDEYAWDSATVVCMLVFSAVGYCLFVLRELHAARTGTIPILNMQLFRNRTVLVAFFGFILTGMVMFTMMTFLPVYFQQSRYQSSAVMAGIRVMPLMFGIIIAVTLSGRYMAATGKFRFFPLISSCMCAVGSGMLSLIDQEDSYGYLFVCMLISGVGIGLCISVVLVAVQNTVPRQDMASATAGVGFARSLGGSIGLAIYGAVANSTRSGPDPSSNSTHFIFAYLVIPCVLGAAVYSFMPRGKLRGPQSQPSQVDLNKQASSTAIQRAGSELTVGNDSAVKAEGASDEAEMVAVDLA